MIKSKLKKFLAFVIAAFLFLVLYNYFAIFEKTNKIAAVIVIVMMLLVNYIYKKIVGKI